MAIPIHLTSPSPRGALHGTASPALDMEDAALQLFLKINEPKLPEISTPGRTCSRISARTPKSSRRAAQVDPRSQMGAPDTRDSASVRIMTEEEIRRRCYWRKWEIERKRELMKEMAKDVPQRVPVYTAHCGPKYKYRRSASLDSTDTDISLFSTSTLQYNDENNVKKLKRRYKKKSKREEADRKLETQGPGWESFAKQRKGLLDAMISKDTGNLEGFVKGKVIDRAKATDIMSREEINLITRCAYTTGLACKEKAASTENLVSFYTRGLPKSEEKMQSRDLDTGSRSRSRSPQIPISYRTGRTPSPRLVARTHERRPASALPFLNIPDSRRDSDAVNNSTNWRAYSSYSKQTGTTGVHGNSRRGSMFPSLVRKQVGTKTTRKIEATLVALYGMTGYGDETSVMASQEDEAHFTAADYSKTVRYPQNIRVAPHLAKVITNDIRTRMGRPRRRQISERDVKLWNEDKLPLGRTHRNLIIFDWLRNVDEDDYELTSPPDITDLEGERPRTRAFPTLVAGLVGEVDERFTFSRGRSSVSARFSDTPFYEDDYSDVSDGIYSKSSNDNSF